MEAIFAIIHQVYSRNLQHELLQVPIVHVEYVLQLLGVVVQKSGCIAAIRLKLAVLSSNLLQASELTNFQVKSSGALLLKQVQLLLIPSKKDQDSSCFLQ